MLSAEMKATKDAKLYQRLKIIELSRQGHTVPQLSQQFAVYAETIRRYIHSYNDAGLAGLRPGYGQGRPVTLDWSQAQWLDV